MRRRSTSDTYSGRKMVRAGWGATSRNGKCGHRIRLHRPCLVSFDCYCCPWQTLELPHIRAEQHSCSTDQKVARQGAVNFPPEMLFDHMLYKSSAAQDSRGNRNGQKLQFN